MEYDRGILLPDQDSYNYKQDISAATLLSDINLPIYWIGKYTAYEI
jgi:hypothetical protein